MKSSGIRTQLTDSSIRAVSHNTTVPPDLLLPNGKHHILIYPFKKMPTSFGEILKFLFATFSFETIDVLTRHYFRKYMFE